MKSINFKTPCGLKIRLNHRYFFYQIIAPDKYCTDDEIVNNDIMYKATKDIENIYLIPTMLVQIFALLSAVFRMDVLVFCLCMTALYIFGCIWRCSKQDILLNTILTFFSNIYKTIWWLFYIALIVLAILFNSMYLAIPYLAIRLLLCLFSYIGNHIIETKTLKQYGTLFNDTEICAFRVFHRLSESKLKFSDYISQYVSIICGYETMGIDEKE